MIVTNQSKIFDFQMGNKYRVEKENYGLNTAIIGLNNYKHKNK